MWTPYITPRKFSKLNLGTKGKSCVLKADSPIEFICLYLDLYADPTNQEMC